MNRLFNVTEWNGEEAVLGLQETLFHNANGYIGVRGSFEEGYVPGMDSMRGIYINGVYDVTPMKQAELLCNFIEEKETMLNVADTQTIQLTILGEKFSMFEGKVLSYERILDMERGETKRLIDWESPKGQQVRIEITRMTSFVKLPLFLIRYNVTPLNFDGEVEFTSLHISDVRNYCNPKDPRMAAESPEYLHHVACSVEDKASYIVTKTTKSDMLVCSGVSHVCSDDTAKVEVTLAEGEREVIYKISADAKKDQTLTLIKYSVFTDSARYDDVMEAAKAEMHSAMEAGDEFWFAEQVKYLADFWKRSEMQIVGDDGLDRAATFNMYTLLQAAAKDRHCNIAAKGLSGEGYEGHYFWDTEMFMLPFFTLTNPELAKMLLAYRCGTLEKARENARLLGHHKGALYPWRTITGVECSGYFPSGSAQYHINGDIAYAFIRYYLSTKDKDFFVDGGAEVIFETARLWMDAGNFFRGKFHINDVTGPDEYTCIVNNNYYTNCGAKYNLKWAYKFYHMLKGDAKFDEMTARIGLTEEEVDSFLAAAEAMYLPYDEETGINPQDDSFLQKPVWDLENTPKDHFPLLLHYHPLYLYRFQVTKQADTVLAHFLYEDEQDEETVKKSFEYYEKITTHDSSLSTCVYSIVAARLGQYDKALFYFGDSAKMDLENKHHNTKDGVHTANMGGCYMAIVNGFAGLRITEEGMSLKPFLPESWSSYAFNIHYEGNLLKIAVDKDVTTVALLDGVGFDIKVNGQDYTLNNEQKEVIIPR